MSGESASWLRRGAGSIGNSSASNKHFKWVAILDNETLKALDFFRIRELLVELCSTELGVEQANRLAPVLTQNEVENDFDRLEEISALESEPPLSGVKDIRSLLSQAEAGGVLTVSELLLIRKVCERLAECQHFFRHYQDSLKALKSVVDRISAVPELQRALVSAIDDSGAIRDTASPRLYAVRSELRKRRNQLVERLERMIETCPERFSATVMVRRERFVLPVKIEIKGQIPGVVHSVSATGQTVFIEPLETIPEQNRLQELRDEEKEELKLIRRALSADIARFGHRLARGIAAVGELDLLMAKSRFARRFECVRPMISADGRLELVGARHPLLLIHRPDVVPLDFYLPDQTRVVVISGPNAGGKTVTLKTIGLCCLLLRCGMFVPARSGTKLPWFNEIFADIGDEQSLEADRSSFTAHLIRMKEILQRADTRSLILIDEIGAATAPEEGSALAIAVLEELRDCQVCTVATTHFNSLKVFVQNEPGMVNAGMEFKNGPTYRLILGLAGDSSALEIAERSGFPDKIIRRARERMGKDWFDLKRKLVTLDQQLRAAELARDEAERVKAQAERRVVDYEQKLKEFENWQKQERQRFLDEQEQELRGLRSEIMRIVREVRKRKADREMVVSAQKFVDTQQVRVAQELMSVSGPVTNFAVGDIVESTVFHGQGRVVENLGDRTKVELGNIKLEVDVKTLRLVARKGEPIRPVVVADFDFVPRLVIRGMTKEEAGLAVDRFLSEAMAAGAQDLSILHGKGTGTLRQMLWQRLRRDPRVAEIRFAEPAQGGMGVTLVKLRGRKDD